MANAVLSAAALIGGIVAFLAAAVTSKILVKVLSRGRGAAREAYEHGDSLANWWQAQAPKTFRHDGLRARRSLAGRIDSELGVVAVEECASQPTYMR